MFKRWLISMPAHRFPSPWTFEEQRARFAVLRHQPAWLHHTKLAKASAGVFVSASYSAAMRKSAKRGEPQIFLPCVTLSASAGGVVSARAFAVPVPNGIGRKQKRATLASTHWKGCWGLPFPQRKRDTPNQVAKKPPHDRKLWLVGLAVLLRGTKSKDEVKT